MWSEAIAPPTPAAASRTPSLRVLVIDDDPLYCRHLQRVAAKLDIHVTCFHPDDDFDALPADGEYDAAVIDYDLGFLKGTQVSALYNLTPVVLISSSPPQAIEANAWPCSIRCFVQKHRGPKAILNKALEQSRMASL